MCSKAGQSQCAAQLPEGLAAAAAAIPSVADQDVGNVLHVDVCLASVSGSSSRREFRMFTESKRSYHQLH